ncbi:chemotaxis protein CheW [Alicyclobacillus macrosporangiidus]|uniref:Purine-binding chemotaxis protein CheW n=1 Tax=Alicyclobacillus macrosporangiidus TaxID=392015 RepID=A0A1I7IR44_9BACL|nr:chemotaxis protein CheW [Alicyclobacillus macrosporangiidus]SFU75435.1 purine-binding chemotaxis protein CheW [Alicyclobacillus macrosporangiidus]
MSERQYILFSVADEQYGVPVEQVQSVERMLPIAHVPKTLPFIKGVVNLRGVVTPVLDLRERFGFPPAEADADTRIVVVQVERFLVGLIVDAVDDVVSIDASAVEPPPAMVGGVEAEYLHGVVRREDRVLILLNLTRVLSHAEERQLREAEKSVTG